MAPGAPLLPWKTRRWKWRPSPSPKAGGWGSGRCFTINSRRASPPRKERELPGDFGGRGRGLGRRRGPHPLVERGTSFHLPGVRSVLPRRARRHMVYLRRRKAPGLRPRNGARDLPPLSCHRPLGSPQPPGASRGGLRPAGPGDGALPGLRRPPPPVPGLPLLAFGGGFPRKLAGARPKVSRHGPGTPVAREGHRPDRFSLPPALLAAGRGDPVPGFPRDPGWGGAFTKELF